MFTPEDYDLPSQEPPFLELEDSMPPHLLPDVAYEWSDESEMRLMEELWRYLEAWVLGGTINGLPVLEYYKSKAVLPLKEDREKVKGLTPTAYLGLLEQYAEERFGAMEGLEKEKAHVFFARLHDLPPRFVDYAIASEIEKKFRIFVRETLSDVLRLDPSTDLAFAESIANVPYLSHERFRECLEVVHYTRTQLLTKIK